MTVRGKSPTRRAALGLAGLALLTLGACTTPFKADVARFQQLPPPQGQSFTVTSLDPALAGGIEFGMYADMVTKEMSELGYVQASDPANADMVVSFAYRIDNGREKVVSDGGWGAGWGPGWGPGFIGRRGFVGAYYWGFYDPFIYGPGFNDVYSYTVYTSALDLQIDRVADNQRLFEGRAEAQSRSKRLQYLVPNLIDALFTDFPGKSGETVRISIAPEEKKVRRID